MHLTMTTAHSHHPNTVYKLTHKLAFVGLWHDCRMVSQNLQVNKKIDADKLARDLQPVFMDTVLPMVCSISCVSLCVFSGMGCDS